MPSVALPLVPPVGENGRGQQSRPVPATALTGRTVRRGALYLRAQGAPGLQAAPKGKGLAWFHAVDRRSSRRGSNRWGPVGEGFLWRRGALLFGLARAFLVGLRLLLVILPAGLRRLAGEGQAPECHGSRQGAHHVVRFLWGRGGQQQQQQQPETEVGAPPRASLLHSCRVPNPTRLCRMAPHLGALANGVEEAWCKRALGKALRACNAGGLWWFQGLRRLLRVRTQPPGVSPDCSCPSGRGPASSTSESRDFLLTERSLDLWKDAIASRKGTSLSSGDSSSGPGAASWASCSASSSGTASKGAAPALDARRPSEWRSGLSGVKTGCSEDLRRLLREEAEDDVAAVDTPLDRRLPGVAELGASF